MAQGIRSFSNRDVMGLHCVHSKPHFSATYRSFHLNERSGLKNRILASVEKSWFLQNAPISTNLSQDHVQFEPEGCDLRYLKSNADFWETE